MGLPLLTIEKSGGAALIGMKTAPCKTDLSRTLYFSAYSAALAPAMRPEVVLQPIVTPS